MSVKEEKCLSDGENTTIYSRKIDNKLNLLYNVSIEISNFDS